VDRFVPGDLGNDQSRRRFLRLAVVSAATAAAAAAAGAGAVAQLRPSPTTIHLVGDAALISGGQSADVLIFKQIPAFTVLGAHLIFGLAVNNLGPDVATNVVISDVLPAATTFVSLTQIDGVAATITTPAVGMGGTVTCSVPTLQVGSTNKLLFLLELATTQTDGQISNTATLNSDTPDPNLANNTSTASTTITPPADLSVTKMGPASAKVNDILTYTIVVTNNGPNPANSVVLTDALDPSTTFDSLTQSTGPAFTLTTPAVGSTGTVTAAIATLASGVSASFTLAVTATQATTVTNIANVTSHTADPDINNNGADVITTVS
jgi:uncharacterized repeat protein (TIGR01451 family)